MRSFNEKLKEAIDLVVGEHFAVRDAIREKAVEVFQTNGEPVPEGEDMEDFIDGVQAKLQSMER